MKSKNVLNKAVNVCGKVVGERQHLRQLYECCVLRKAGVIANDSSHVLAKFMNCYLVDDFGY